MWLSKTRPRTHVFYLGLGLIALGLIASSRALSVLLGMYSVQEVKPKVFAWIPDDVIDQECDPQFSRPAVAGFIITPAGVVVIDTSNSPMHARDLLFEIRRRTDYPVRYVINTSSAGDHISGNEVFVDEESTIISTKAAQEEVVQYAQEINARMHADQGWKLQARMRGFHLVPAEQTFEGKMALNFGGQEIRIISLMESEVAPDDAVVYLPAAKVLYMGELFDNQYFPRVGTRNVHEWIDVLKKVEGWDIDAYVPGHGNPGTRNDVIAFRKFLEWLVDQVEIRVKEGQTEEDIQKALWLPKHYTWRGTDLAADTVADVYRQVAPKKPVALPPAPATPSEQPPPFGEQ